jgi:hypothetical protein
LQIRKLIDSKEEEKRFIDFDTRCQRDLPGFRVLQLHGDPITFRRQIRLDSASTTSQSDLKDAEKNRRI